MLIDGKAGRELVAVWRKANPGGRITAKVLGTIFGSEDLRDAYLRDANLHGADLGGATLEGANLVGADLEGANLVDADLWRANLTGVKGLDLGNAGEGNA